MRTTSTTRKSRIAMRTTFTMFGAAGLMALAPSAFGQAQPAQPAQPTQPAGPATSDAAANKCKESGDHASCAAAGAALETSAADAALDLYTIACTKKPYECYSLISYAQRMLRRKDGAPRGVWVLEKACELKAAPACNMLGNELEEGEHGVAQELPKALRLYDRACELGSPRGCLNAAVMVEDQRGTPAKKDATRASRLRQRAEQLEKAMPRATLTPAELTQAETACRKSQDASRCLMAGAVLQETDAVKAEEVFRISCTADKATCGLWSFAVDRYKKDDAPRATRILEQGCLENTAAACNVLAELHHVGYRGVTRNEQRSSELFIKSCTDGSDANACRTAAARLRQGIGTAKNSTRADELAQRGGKLDEEADKPFRDAAEKFAKDAAALRARDGYQRELERRRAEWRTFSERAKIRSEARMARLAAAEAGQQGNPPPSLVMADGEASKSREGAIRRMASSIFGK